MTYFDRQEPRLSRGATPRSSALGPTARLAQKRRVPWIEIVLVALLLLGAAYAVRFLIADGTQPVPSPQASVAPASPSVTPKPAAAPPKATGVIEAVKPPVAP